MAPASADVRANVALVAPATSAQMAPVESQRRHWNEYVIGVVPLQPPDDAVNPAPTTAVPLIDGAEVFAGADPVGGGGRGVGAVVGRGATTAVSAEVFEADPNLLVAVTTTPSR